MCKNSSEKPGTKRFFRRDKCSSPDYNSRKFLPRADRTPFLKMQYVIGEQKTKQFGQESLRHIPVSSRAECGLRETKPTRSRGTWCVFFAAITSMFRRSESRAERRQRKSGGVQRANKYGPSQPLGPYGARMPYASPAMLPEAAVGVSLRHTRKCEARARSANRVIRSHPEDRGSVLPCEADS
jgi:hypothetical protein